jgi:hypothetical protein
MASQLLPRALMRGIAGRSGALGQAVGGVAPRARAPLRAHSAAAAAAAPPLLVTFGARLARESEAAETFASCGAVLRPRAERPRAQTLTAR